MSLNTQKIILELKLSKGEYRINNNSVRDSKGYIVGEVGQREITIHYAPLEEDIEKDVLFKDFLREEKIPYSEGEHTKRLTLLRFKKKKDYYESLIKKIEE